jgi:hypothetical protein
MTADLGRDTSCTTSLRTGRFVTGPLLVAEAIYRRLTTPRGMLRGGEEEANYGLDLTELIGETNPKNVIASLPGRIRSELSKDERVLSATITVVATLLGVNTALEVAIAATTSAGPFTLKLLASAVTVELLGITT